MTYWLRLYTSILDDPKVQRLPADQFRGWINLLCLAKEHDGLLPSIEDIGFRLRMANSEAQSLVEVLVRVGLLDKAEDGLTPHNWNGRQFLSDDDPTAALRARRYRKRTRDGTDAVTRDANRDDTDAEVYPSRPPETETETETESESEQKQSRGVRAKPRTPKRPSNCDEEFLAELQADPAYAMLDVTNCFHRCVVWCRNKGVQPTRSRFINWLNREDKPMGVGNGKVATGKTNDANGGSAQKTTDDYGIRDCKVLGQ